MTLAVLLTVACAPDDGSSAATTPAGGPDRSGTQQPSLVELFTRAHDARERGDWSAVLQAYLGALERAPLVPALIYAAAGAEARLGHTTASQAHLQLLARLGATADIASDDAFASVLDQPDVQAVAETLRSNGEPQVPAEVLVAFADAELWPEGIAFDPETGDLYVGSIKRRSIVRITPDGRAEELGASSQDGLLEVLGVWVDPERRHLWAATGKGDSSPPFDGEPRRNELVQYDLRSGSLLARYPVPDDETRLLNDVVVAPDGTAFATETLRGEVFQVRPGQKLELYRRFPDHLHLNGIALSGDGSTLYLAHYGGLTAVDLASGEAAPVEGEVALCHADGLSWVENQLVLVQNNRYLGFRVVRVELDRTGRRAVGLEILPSGVPEGLIPYTCAVGSGAVYVVAAAPFSLLDRGEVPPPPVVVHMPLAAGERQ